MKTTLRLMVFASIVLASYPAHAGGVYEIHIIGYYNYSFVAGSTLFTSQLDQSPNNLSTLFQSSTPADGTTLSLWNPATQTFNAAST